MKKPKQKANRKTLRINEVEEIQTLNSWIDSQKPDSGTNPLSFPPMNKKAPVGRIGVGEFSSYVGATRFDQLPISRNTKNGLKEAGFVKMTDIQRAALSHSLCGRDILGAAKTGSGKTLAFVIPVSDFFAGYSKFTFFFNYFWVMVSVVGVLIDSVQMVNLSYFRGVKLIFICEL